MDTQVFLIHLFKSLIEALSINAVPRRPPSKIPAEVLEVAKADILNRLEKYSFDCGSDIHSEEIKKHIESTSFRHFILDYTSAKKRISSAIEIPFAFHTSSFKSYKEEVPHWVSIDFWPFVLRQQLDLGVPSHYNFKDYLATSTLLLRKGVVSKEWETREQGDEDFEIVKSQALEKIGASAEQIISSPDLSDVINKTVSFAHDIYNACKKGVSLEEIEETLQQKAQTLLKKSDIFLHRPKPADAVQPPDLSGIPLWQGSKRGEKALDYLKTHYGQYLSAFGAEQNNVFQDQLRAHDPKLVQGVINQLREEGRGRKVGDFVKTRSARVDRELKNIDPEYLSKAHREVHRLKVAARRRNPKS